MTGVRAWYGPSRERSRHSAVWLCLVASCTLAGTLAGVTQGAAHAQKLVVELEAKNPPEPTETNKNPTPSFEVHVKGAPGGLAAKDFELKQLDRPPPLTPSIQFKASDVKMYPESSTKMALVVLIQGNGHWMGNESYAEESGETPQQGAFSGLGPALDELAKAGPKGSVATVLTYGDGKTTVKYEMSESSKLSGLILGGQKDYKETLDFPLLVGLEQAIAIFDNHAGYRKILVSIGDGTGEREDIGADLTARVEELQKRHIESYSIFYDPTEGGQKAGYPNMSKLGYTDHKEASSRENFATFTKSFTEAINAVYYVAFPGCTPSTPPTELTCMTHDGGPHEFALVLQGEEGDPIEVQTKVWLAPKPPKETSLWWLWLILAVLGVFVLVLIIVKVAKRQPAPVPMPMEMPVMEAPPQAGPLKTMMIGLGGSEDGMPIVGWLVPLNGPNQYQTFKLLDGITKIGTGGGANIIVQDHFMSTEHCEIISSPKGFKLKDSSTNGTMVNEHPVKEHELVDNDYLTMGKTNFKFKSIN